MKEQQEKTEVMEHLMYLSDVEGCVTYEDALSSDDEELQNRFFHKLDKLNGYDSSEYEADDYESEEDCYSDELDDWD